jgi:6-phosphofructokinase 1
MNTLIPENLNIKKLGEGNYLSPLKLSKVSDDDVYDYILDSDRILYDDALKTLEHCKKENIEPLSLEKAGPREKLFFNPAGTNAAIVSCGGLCPGMNDVVRSLVMEMHYRYGVKRVLGISYGYSGFIPEYGFEPIELTPERVTDIHLFGGTILGSSRGEQSVLRIVDFLVENEINILFTIGGDGTLRGAHDIYQEITKRGLDISIAGIPKTIDNDICFIEKSFGFETAFTIATQVIRGAHNEAIGAYNGISLIKLMGRDSGFIAANAAVAMPEVNFVLVPEMEFDLYGEKGFFKALEHRLAKRHHAVVVVAEGAGQNLFENNDEIIKDASGNVVHKDIGLYLKHKMNSYFKELGIDFTIKYIDPSYTVRSAPATANDSMFCSLLAQNAVHGAMAGKTDFVTGTWHNQFIYLPIPIAIEKRKKIDLESPDWWYVLEATGQPVRMKN